MKAEKWEIDESSIRYNLVDEDGNIVKEGLTFEEYKTHYKEKHNIDVTVKDEDGLFMYFDDPKHPDNQ